MGVCFLAISNSFPVNVMIHNSFCNREEKLLLGVKIASAIVVLMIFTVVLIVKLRECRSHSSCGSSVSEGDSVTNSQIIIQLPALNTDDGSVLASG